MRSGRNGKTEPAGTRVDGRDSSLAYVETDTATVFHDAPDAVAAYDARMRHLADSALTSAQSRDAFARWADTYDRQARPHQGRVVPTHLSAVRRCLAGG
nr:Scr1 family TA system antitoxin-like transcriptional regulator [Saccharothrix sp. NRRL B-16314]